jgi:low temperature requirement protein LtrA
MIIAVTGVWATAAFVITLLDIERSATRTVLIAVMGLALFMNAGIARAFDDSAWLFAIPMLLATVSACVSAAARAPTPQMREHFRRMLMWIGASAPFWVAGALVDPELRFWLWAVAVVIDFIGSFTAHPLPGRVMRSQRLAFDSAHMLERMRLFLIILLGETVLSIGRALSGTSPIR